MASPAPQDNRWELYRILGEPSRLRLLAVTAAEELAIGELAELLGESQPNVSRQLAPLRRLGLVAERRHGTRVFVRLDASARRDAVIADALATGEALCRDEGVLQRVPELVRRRDAAAREFFARPAPLPSEGLGFPAELPAYLAVLGGLLPRRALALDIGTGDGRLLEVLAPTFERVLGVDREHAQLTRAEQRVRERGFGNVELSTGELDDPALAARVAELGGADAVFASRILHHAPRPAEAVARLAGLLAPGGSLLIIDYQAHQDERLREEQADLWLGFATQELLDYARGAGLDDPRALPLPPRYCGNGPDAHLGWQVMTARRPVPAKGIKDGEP
jgi:DNA-binding transcriptional ArsR family regulator